MKQLLTKSKINSTFKKILPALVLAAIMLPLCLGSVETAHAVYVISNNDELFVVDGMPDDAYTSKLIEINKDAGGADAQIILKAGETVSISYDGADISTVSRKETIANLLRRLNIVPDADDMIAVDISGNNVVIQIDSSLVYNRDVDVETDYETEYVTNPLLPKGTEQVVQEGVKGLVTQTYADTYVDGQVISTDFVRQTEDNSVTEIIEQGTRVSSVDSSARIVDVITNDDGSGYLAFDTGETMSFSSEMACSATAYSGGTRTASGYPTGVGNIAVDPSVIPYGTRMYIQTTSGAIVYGMAVARDCGSAIKGNIIDLWFSTYDESCRWGRRSCSVFILD
ncbi:MAG: hydrolase [Clostridiales bacterium]|nr:hydrolase [Clostridiales bacterium]